VQRVLADVRNTYGGRHSYWLTPEGQRLGHLRATATKSLYVSPFMAFDVGYEFLLTPPGESLVAHMNVWPDGGVHRTPTFDATLTLRRRPWTASSLRATLLRQPLMTAKVIGAIHWEALRLRRKGLPIVPMPTRPS
jgi:DUF1365 family protein